jgi:hypothetical protein
MRNGLRHCDGIVSWNVAGSVEKEMRPSVRSGVRRVEGEVAERDLKRVESVICGVTDICCSSCFAPEEIT